MIFGAEKDNKAGLVQYAPPLESDIDRLYDYFNNRVCDDVTGIEKSDVARTTLLVAKAAGILHPDGNIKAAEYVQIDLNCLIYKMLKNLEYFSELPKYRRK